MKMTRRSSLPPFTLIFPTSWISILHSFAVQCSAFRAENQTEGIASVVTYVCTSVLSLV